MKTEKFSGGGQNIGPKTVEEFVFRAKNGKLIFMLPITLFYREKAIEAGGYRQEGFPEGEIRYQDLSEDLDLWSRMSDFYQKGFVMLTIPKALYYYRKTHTSLSTGKDRQLAMNYKIAFIKYNLKLRRANKTEVSFKQFIAEMSLHERKKLESKFKAGYLYREAAFEIMDHQYISAIIKLIRSFIASPEFMVQKLKANFAAGK